jgi:hypothetical protein
VVSINLLSYLEQGKPQKRQGMKSDYSDYHTIIHLTDTNAVEGTKTMFRAIVGGIDSKTGQVRRFGIASQIDSRYSATSVGFPGTRISFEGSREKPLRIIPHAAMWQGAVDIDPVLGVVIDDDTKTLIGSVAAIVNGIEITEYEVEARVETEFKKVAAKISTLSASDIEQYKKQLRQQVLETLIVEQLINISEDEAKKYYAENQKEFQLPEKARASHILIKPDTSEPGTDPNQAKAKAKAKAEDLLKQIKEGADFAELAKAISDCPSAAKGGDLDFFSRGQMVAPFEKAAFALKPSEISEVVETPYGYHIIKVTDHKDAGLTPFEQAKDGIIGRLKENRRSQSSQEYVKSLKSKATIIYPSAAHDAATKPIAGEHVVNQIQQAVKYDLTPNFIFGRFWQHCTLYPWYDFDKMEYRGNRYVFKEGAPFGTNQEYDNDKMGYLVEFGENWGGKEGATVQFKKGKVGSCRAIPTFVAEGTQARVGDKTYMFENGRWLEQ